MQVAWGTYEHTENETQLVTFTVRPRMSQRGLRMERVYRAHLRGELKDTTQAGLTTKIQDLIAAYSNDFRDFELRDNSGNLTPQSFSNSDSRNVSGNRVVYRSWDGRDPSAYAIAFAYEIILEATMAEPESGLLYLTESIETIGTGGMVWIADNTQNGPQATVIYPTSWRRIVQHGTAIYYFGPATANSPAFPINFEHQERRRIIRGEPRFRGQGYTHYPISWHYEFSSI